MPESNGALIRKIENLLGAGDMSQKAAVTLVLEAQYNLLVEISELKKSFVEALELNEQRFLTIENRVEDMDDEAKRNPTFLWLLKNKTKETVKTILLVVVIIVLISYVAVSNDFVRQVLMKYLGIA